MAKMELVALTAKYSIGAEVRLYGYPVIQEGEIVGIVVPNGRERGKIYHAYRLVGGVITDSYSYRTRKEAFAFFTPKTESTSLEAVKIVLSLAIAVETVLARIDGTNIHTTIGEMKDTWQILRDAL